MAESNIGIARGFAKMMRIAALLVAGIDSILLFHSFAKPARQHTMRCNEKPGNPK